MSLDPSTHARTLAWRYLEMHQPRRALDALGTLGGDDLQDPVVWYIRGRALLELEDHDHAAQLARDALGRWPEDVELLSVLAEAEAGRDRLADAEEAVLRALRLEADSDVLLAQYARILMRGAQLDKAEVVLDLATEAEPDSLAAPRAAAARVAALARPRGAPAER